MKRLLKEEGQVLVFTVLCMTVLLGFVALATDAGLLFRAKRNLQTAADAAAFAGAVELFYNGPTNVVSVAKAAAKANGYDATASGTSVLVFTPPNDGPDTGCASCIEVVIKSKSYTSLATFAGKSSFNVAARAVAGAPGLSDDCIWLVDPSVSGQLTMQGGQNSQLNASGCSVYLNSNSSTAVSLTGNPNVTINSLNDVSTQNVSTKANFTGTINTGVTPQSPPLATDTQGPTPSNGGCNGSNTDTSTTLISTTYAPAGGVSAGGVVCFSQAITLANGAVLPGALNSGMIYVFENGLTIANGATVSSGTYTGTLPPPNNVFDSTKTYGATLDIEGGAFNMSANNTTYLSAYAPTSGVYNGIALMQPSAAPQPNLSSSSIQECNNITACMDVQFGSSGTYFDGMIFNPGGQVIMHDAGGGVKATGVIAASMNIKSSQLSILNYSSANPLTSPLRYITMVE